MTGAKKKAKGCRFESSWGCFAWAPRPPEGPRWYRCLLERGHEGKHVVEVAGRRVERDRIPELDDIRHGRKVREIN